MKHKKKYILLIGLLLVLIAAVIAIDANKDLLGTWLFNSTPTEIRGGFSPGLLSVLQTQYQVTVPEEAVFVKGINTNAFRDPSVVILFELPIDGYISAEDDSRYSYGCQALSLDESRYQFDWFDQKIYADWFDEFGGILDYRIVDKTDPFTFISYSVGDKALTIRFVGRHPGAVFD